MIGEPPDRAAIVEALFEELRGLPVAVGDDAVGVGRIVCVAGGRCVGLVVAKEIFARVGVRARALVEEGTEVRPATAVVEVGGPVAAIRGAAPLALTWLHRLGAVASGAAPPEAGNPLDAYAALLSRSGARGQDGPSFRLELEG